MSIAISLENNRINSIYTAINLLSTLSAANRDNNHVLQDIHNHIDHRLDFDAWKSLNFLSSPLRQEYKICQYSILKNLKCSVFTIPAVNKFVLRLRTRQFKYDVSVSVRRNVSFDSPSALTGILLNRNQNLFVWIGVTFIQQTSSIFHHEDDRHMCTAVW